MYDNRFLGIAFPNTIDKAIKLVKVNNIKPQNILKNMRTETNICPQPCLPTRDMSKDIVLLHGVDIGIPTIGLVRPLSKCASNACRVPDMKNIGVLVTQF